MHYISTYNDSDLGIISQKMDYRINFWFSFRCDIIHRPFKLLIFIFIIFTPCLAYLIRLAELPYIDINDQEKQNNVKVD